MAVTAGRREARGQLEDPQPDRRLPRALPSDGGCDHRQRAAFCTLADASRRHNPWAADIYDCARARGVSHTHATRIRGRAWSEIIRRLWHDHDTYDPLQHTTLQRSRRLTQGV
jgi:hypothetical protein